MPAEAIRYIDKAPAILYGGNVDTVPLTCKSCNAEYRIHYSNSEFRRLEDSRYLAKVRIDEEHPHHERSILL
jgi:RNase P subunit RPR2